MTEETVNRLFKSWKLQMWEKPMDSGHHFKGPLMLSEFVDSI